MSTPIVTARRNLVQRISNLLRKAGDGELNLTPWQLSQVQETIRASASTRPAGRKAKPAGAWGADRPSQRGPLTYAAGFPLLRRGSYG